MASNVALDELIMMTPGVRGGKPRIADRRITVADVAIWHEYHGWSADQIAREFTLSLTQVHAALAYYFAHRDEVEDSIKEDVALADAIRRANPSLIKQRLNDEQP
jgi:uncharacterized protein (DUF433 family)